MAQKHTIASKITMLLACGVLAAASVNFALAQSSSALLDDPSTLPGPSSAAVAEAAEAAKHGRILVPGHRYTVEELAAEKAKILAVDEQRLDAWRKGDVKKLDSFIADDAKIVDGFAKGADQLLNKEQFLAHVKGTPLPKTVNGTDRTVRTFGIEDDVAIVNGTVTDGTNTSDRGGIYTAIYLRNFDRSWEMVRYEVSPMLSDPFHPATTPPKAWSFDSLSLSQQRVMEILRRHFDALARRDNVAIEKTIGDDFWYIRGGAPGGNQHGKAEYMAYKKSNTGAPELVTIDEPDIQFYGNYGEVAVVNGIRRDATGGAVFGSDFKPQWRTEAYYTAVILRPSVQRNVWLLEHYHAAYIRP